MSIGRLIAVGTCLVLRAADLQQSAAALDHESNPARLAAAAAVVAGSQNPDAIARLGKHLTERAFLRQLDPDGGFSHLDAVFRAAAAHPSKATESLCIQLAGNAEFTSQPSRLNYLLNALAAVRPMSDAAAKVFRTTSRSGYLEVNGPLLARNGSPKALDVLQELLSDESLNVEQRVSIAHWGVLPVRTDPGIAAMCARLLMGGHISHQVEVAILESLFDYQPKRWFGVRSSQPAPPSWNTAPLTTRAILRSLGRSSLQRKDLPAALRPAIEKTLAAMA
jgi:hypothetical protein